MDEYQPNGLSHPVEHRHFGSSPGVKSTRSSQVSARPRKGLGPAVKPCSPRDNYSSFAWAMFRSPRAKDRNQNNIPQALN